VTTTAPPPGTVAAKLPVPAAVQEARRLHADGVKPAEGAERLAGRFDVAELRTARDWWVRRMPRTRWDDPTPTAILRMLEMALVAVDGLAPPTQRPGRG
jgi:hypothetical protein